VERANKDALVTTLSERCRVCYTCVRECPAKAIRIADGQAQIMGERCIACGNCVRVCSQNAKQVRSTIEEVIELLESDRRVAACIAPSFPAAFTYATPPQMVGMLRALGFDLVTEVGFGADIVAAEYRKLLRNAVDSHYISSNCPAVVGYIERYFPHLVPSLAPIVSPMVAMARVLHLLHGDDLDVVFIGPCIAKKGEAVSLALREEMASALTFVELSTMFAQRGLTVDSVTESDFDPPYAGMGALFPISRGMLQAANIEQDLVADRVVATEGRTNFVTAVREFASGDLDASLLEVLACEGCIMGPCMRGNDTQFRRRARVSRYVRDYVAKRDPQEHQQALDRCTDIDLHRTFAAFDQRIPVPSESQIHVIMARMGKQVPEDELNCGACGYDSCREHAIAIHKGLAESEMCLPYAIDKLGRTVSDLAVSNQRLAETQEALVQSEKLASMGQLAAGIAHELNNPLGIVLMYAHILRDEHGRDGSMRDDLGMITEQADRCKKIVAGLLHFARQNKVSLESVDVRDVIERSVRMVPAPETVAVDLDLGREPCMADLDKDQIVQVLTNLVSNAYAAMPKGGALTVRLQANEENISMSISDTGMGIPRDNQGKIFEPFFTTKDIGEGTGLGLAVAYGIVKMHRGDIVVESNADTHAGPTGTTFTVVLPRRGQTG
jgi:signal transduction histidine kinase/NAD-dependent dihydropyrimidine dehydrogenase PreA subunit